MPGRKLPGKLDQLERAGASLLHNSRAAAAGRRGPLTCTGRVLPPNPGWGAQRAEARHQAPALRDPGTGGTDPRPPGPAPAAASRSPLLQTRAPAWGLCAPAPRWVTAAGSLGTLRPRLGSPPPARPLAAPSPLLGQAYGPKSPGRRVATEGSQTPGGPWR